MKRLLIANRGEIALRILRACRELGIEVVAPYTRADEQMVHLPMADDRICVGRHSYLDAGQLISAAQVTGCDAIHPGYGFLSEDAAFASAVESAEMTFVGPAPEQIAMMGDKASARSLLQAAGVPVLPGSEGIVADVRAAVSAAAAIGYPVMLKAAAGGGGRGILLAGDEETLVQDYATVSAQAEVLFGNPGVYIEKYVADARHIEIQVIGDGNGRVLHLGARECSIQRRHQKLLEEAPPPGIPDNIIESLGRDCCRALETVNYRNAGTLEFLYSSGDFFFIEMNTRIQVEHPVTELVTGVDLVKLQLETARDQGFTLTQSSVSIDGHAMECRINAEDENFLPAPGKVQMLHLPDGPGIRVDTHLYQGYEVPHQYDSLLAKLVTHGSDRDEARLRMHRALQELQIRHLPTTAPVHQAIIESENFVRGSYDTGFIEKAGLGGSHAVD